MRINSRLFVALVGGFALLTAACSSDGPDIADAKPASAAGAAAPAPAVERQDPVALHKAMRKLWEDHVMWTRLYIVSAVAGLPDAEATAGRLLQNQVDIGNAIKPYYGEEAGAKLTELLRGHILTAADLLTAAKAGDQSKLGKAQADWYANADEIAAFLAGANPAWPAETLKSMMRTHLDQTLAEATARLQGDWTKDIAQYEHIHAHILEMSDALAAGIVTQFPARFTTSSSSSSGY